MRVVRGPRDPASVEPALIGGIFGLSGVVIGASLNAWSASWGRKQVSAEGREKERRERELVVAERLDEALVRASAALDRDRSLPLDQRYQQAYDEWQDAWVAYSSRLRQPELLRRYRSVGSLLAEVVLNDRTAKQFPRHMVATAIANARATLAFFMRGEDALPPTAFPEPAELRRLIGEGDRLPDPARPLKDWLGQHPMPDFHGGADE
jgi:hypothetical protein